MLPTNQQVAHARRMMSQGLSMQQSAIVLGVRSGDLDAWLWAYISVPTEDLEPKGHKVYAADFE